MKRQGFIGALVVIMAVASILVFCQKDTPTGPTPQPTDITGVWTDTVQMVFAALRPDTFTCNLNITATGYKLLRSHKFYGSSNYMVDSSREEGTYVKNSAGDQVTLTPTPDKCFYYDPAQEVWFKCDGTVTSLFKECGPPMTFKISIANKVWSGVEMVRYDDQQAKVTFDMNKH